MSDYSSMKIRRLHTLILCLTIGAALFAQHPPLGGDRDLALAPDSSDLRNRLWHTHIELNLTEARSAAARIETNAWGRWKFSRTSQGNSLYTIISPERDGQWPVYAQGSWILRRSASTGLWDQAKIFLRSDPELYIKLYPFGDRTQLDVLAYGAVLYHRISLPLSFDRVLKLPLAAIMELSRDIIDWQLFSPTPSLYADIRQFGNLVKEQLAGLRYVDDGAIDENGQAVSIADLLPQAEPAGLNCSGFLKWLVDGMLYPLTGQYLSISRLKDRMLDYRGSGFTLPWEDIYDPFFGLDWSRALAVAAWSTIYRQNSVSPLEHDVVEPGFVLLNRNNDPLQGSNGYIPFPAPQAATGLHLSGLKAYLFLLAAREPGRMYFAQFNARDTTAPVLRRFFHVAALLPYFDEDGIFRVRVFESAEETSLNRILNNPRYEFVHLIRMPVLRRFSPPVLR